MREAIAHILDIQHQLRLLRLHVGWSHKPWVLTPFHRRLLYDLRRELGRWRHALRHICTRRGVPVPLRLDDDGEREA